MSKLDGTLHLYSLHTARYICSFWLMVAVKLACYTVSVNLGAMRKNMNWQLSILSCEIYNNIRYKITYYKVMNRYIKSHFINSFPADSYSQWILQTAAWGYILVCFYKLSANGNYFLIDILTCTKSRISN